MATYYVSTVDGNDSYNGLYPTYQSGSDRPWLTFAYAKANFPVVAGNSLLFNRGNTWDIWTTPNQDYAWAWGADGSSGNQITVGAYGTGAKPVIRAVLDVKGSSDDWTDMGSNRWRKTIDFVFTPRRLWLDGAGFSNKESVQPSAYTGINGTKYLWYFDEGNTYLYIYSTANPATNYNSVNVVKERPFMGQWDGRSYWTVENIEFRGGAPFYFSCVNRNVTNIIFSGVDFYDFCSIAIDLNGRNASYAITNITVDGCVFDSNFNLISTTGLTEPEVSGLVYESICNNDGTSNSIFKNSTFIDTVHQGVGFLGDNSSYSGCNYNVVEYNTFINEGSPYSRPMGCAGITGRCVGNIFRYNYMAHHNTDMGFNGEDTEVYYNIIYHKDTTIISGQWEQSQGIMLQAESPYVCDGVKIYNNLIMECYAEGIILLYFGVDSSPINCEIKNNIFVNNGYGGHGDWHSQSNTQIYIQTGVSTSNVIDKNCFYSSSTNDTVVYHDDVARTVAWADANTVEFVSNLASDPKVGSDFKIASDSPCKDMGLALSLTPDYFGTTVPQGSAPDIGVHEYIEAEPIYLIWTK